MKIQVFQEQPHKVVLTLRNLRLSLLVVNAAPNGDSSGLIQMVLFRYKELCEIAMTVDKPLVKMKNKTLLLCHKLFSGPMDG